jgi:hypothetical protein
MKGKTACETRWTQIFSSFEENDDDLLQAHSEGSEELAHLRTGLQTTGQLIRVSPPANSDGVV